ncbi:MAG: tRNA 5-methoxyuridine(34)/uridine 5-oxyacetic acid(34) synthase CmoB [Lamprobacter sp.]|uniref:tRNA 5-methoxyuridine(34)/uridine 5-oxyacetic acid(34) synthase CmoB n=1 Tax=Lamprobacter sp. TaxID=3100796 RepID=UPI002B262F50|nr:tRNA 5-methoxyuridine(34)/uridine 5-oxyacetic acid(34) synthase CmoB [Lamprobacter sp.]MEA3638639.1 tRNA 5-methoxyuridine(34)/uridine 5-oxyacetic acid(34) synthase CmoB [Lamprobacter sp.]
MAADTATAAAAADATLAGAQVEASGQRLYRAAIQRFEPWLQRLATTPLAPWAPALRQLSAERLQPARHGDLAGWFAVLEQLEALNPPAARRVRRHLDQPCVGVAAEPPLPSAQGTARRQLLELLERLHPWRKGPFCLHGIRIDAEWRSDWKWARLAEAIAPLHGRRVLDVGCGNGYYGFRALGAGADLVLGIDPTLRFVAQFLALNQVIGAERLAVLPLADDDLPDLCAVAAGGFETLFSMGVLYHRRDPLQHLRRVRDCLRPGGQLVLETLVLDRPEQPLLDGQILRPAARYAQMRNVHAIPSVATLKKWLGSAGYQAIELVDLARTSRAEQRSTDWMRFQSLADFLAPDDPELTVEGHPAPVRAILLAQPDSAR